MPPTTTTTAAAAVVVVVVVVCVWITMARVRGEDEFASSIQWQ